MNQVTKLNKDISAEGLLKFTKRSNGLYSVSINKSSLKVFNLLKFMAIKAAASGIVDIYIDNTEVASFDQYNSVNVYNSIFTQTGITVSGAGLKTVKLRIDGKNVLSTDHRTTFSFIRLGDSV